VSSVIGDEEDFLADGDEVLRVRGLSARFDVREAKDAGRGELVLPVCCGAR
jgi:hypothetical protein